MAMKGLRLDENELTGRFLFAHCIAVVHECTNPDFQIRLCTGPIPTELGQLTAIEEVYLSSNKFTGKFLFAHCTSVVHESPKH